MLALMYPAMLTWPIVLDKLGITRGLGGETQARSFSFWPTLRSKGSFIARAALAGRRGGVVEERKQDGVSLTSNVTQVVSHRANEAPLAAAQTLFLLQRTSLRLGHRVRRHSIHEDLANDAALHWRHDWSLGSSASLFAACTAEGVSYGGFYT